MKLTTDNLAEQGFTLQDELEHQNLVPFIRMYMKKRTTSAITYQVLNGVAAAVLLYAMLGVQSDLTWDNRIMQLSFGVLAAFLLIPLHEYIHVLAYKSQGAQHTSYAANIKKFYFMALADGFVANRKAFRVVALAPFVTITLALIVVAILVPANWCMLPLSTLLAHAAMCSGDFGLLSYFDAHKDKEVVTYDDVQKGISYFYVRKGEQ